MIFNYKGYSKEGLKIKSKIEAISLEDAKRKLVSQGVLYQSVSADKSLIFKKINFVKQKKISFSELSIISRDLSVYIKSGISIVNAVKLALNQYKTNPKHILFFESILDTLNEGKNFYQSLENQTIYSLPTFFKQSIKVSENGGILGEVLLELSQFLKEQDKINKQVQNALAYPMFIFSMSIIIVFFMLSVIVPKITSIFEDLKQDIPPITQFVIDSGAFLEQHWLTILIVLILLYSGFYLLARSSRSFKKSFDVFKLKLPLFGSIMYKNEMGRFAYVSYVLIKSGVPFAKTINLASNVLNNLYLKDIFSKASEKVVEGDKLSNALYKSSQKIDSYFLQAISLGEETSQMEQMLQNLSTLYFEENKDKTAILLSLLEPALMLFVGLIVGFIITAMLLPIFSINIG